MIDPASSIVTDEHDEPFDAESAFLSLLRKDDPDEGPSDEDEDAPVAPPSETEEDAATDPAVPADPAKTTDPNDPEFDVKVGDTTHKAKLSELKRLFGQEASLTQKSQQAAEALKAAVNERTVAAARLGKLVENAEAAYKPYAELDMLVLSQRMNTEDFAQLRQDAALAKSNVEFLRQEQSGALQDAQNAAHRDYVAASQRCIAALENPDTGLKGFGREMYGQMQEFAKAEGFNDFHRVVDPAAIRLVHKAMEYDKMQKAAKAAALKTTKVVHAATKVARPGATTSDPDTSTYASAMKRLRATGSSDAAVEAFAALERRST